MVVENKELQRLFKVGKEGDWNPFFEKAYDVVNYAITTKFSNISLYHYDPESLKQDCIEQIWKLIDKKDRIQEDGNIFSYIIGAVDYLMRDNIRKANRRRKKAVVINTDQDPRVLVKNY